jgi:hypothetical protein
VNERVVQGIERGESIEKSISQRSLEDTSMPKCQV